MVAPNCSRRTDAGTAASVTTSRSASPTIGPGGAATDSSGFGTWCTSTSRPLPPPSSTSESNPSISMADEPGPLVQPIPTRTCAMPGASASSTKLPPLASVTVISVDRHPSATQSASSVEVRAAELGVEEPCLDGQLRGVAGVDEVLQLARALVEQLQLTHQVVGGRRARDPRPLRVLRRKRHEVPQRRRQVLADDR